jgi:hypothetical protein
MAFMAYRVCGWFTIDAPGGTAPAAVRRRLGFTISVRQGAPADGVLRDSPERKAAVAFQLAIENEQLTTGRGVKMQTSD